GRGLWTTFAAAPPPPALPARAPVQVATTAPRPALLPRETTGAVEAPWVRLADAADRIPGELALSYAAQQTKIAPQAPVTRSLAPTTQIPREEARIAPPRVAAAKPTPQI